jgi:hypothetical protein
MPTNLTYSRRVWGGSNLPVLERIIRGEVVPWPGRAVRDEIATAEFFDDRAQTPEAQGLISTTLDRWLSEEIEIEVTELIKTRPGHRPPIWWQHRAPEPRARLGGIGDLLGDVYGRGGYPRYRLGLPDEEWITTKMQQQQAAIGLRVHGTPVDLAFPPIYESEPAFLKRHRLLSASEARRLTPEDFEPEPIAVECPTTPTPI